MAKKFENPAELVASAQLVESAQTAMADIQRREEIEALTNATKILSEYGPALKNFPDIADRNITACNLVIDVFREGIHLKPGFGKTVIESLSPTLETFVKKVSDEHATFRTEFKDDRTALQSDFAKERSAFAKEMAKLHEAQLDAIRATHRRNLADIDRKDSRIAVPPYIIYVVTALLLLLAIHFGATLIAILTDTPTARLATITVIFLAFMILLPTLIIYLHRQEYL